MDSKLTNISAAREEKKQDLKEDISSLKHSLKESQNSLYKAVSDVKNIAQAALNQSLQAIKSKSEDGQENIARYTRSHPVKTVLYSVFAGALAAKIFQMIK